MDIYFLPQSLSSLSVAPPACPWSVQVVNKDSEADHTVMDDSEMYECQPTFTRFI